MKRVIATTVLGASLTVASAGDWLNPNLTIPLIPVRALGVEGVIFPQERANEALVGDGVVKYWTPSTEVVEQLERQLKPFLESARENPSIGYRWKRIHKVAAENRSREFGKILEHYSEYRRQYVGIVVGKSKRVFVNCFLGRDLDGSDSHAYWTRQFVFVNDGGFRYWTAEYDVAQQRFVIVESNGYA